MRLMSMNNCCYFIQIIKAQRYTSYIKVMTLSGLTLVALKEAMLRLGAEKAMMSGSGPTVFGLFTNPKAAQDAYEALRFGKESELAKQVYLTNFFNVGRNS